MAIVPKRDQAAAEAYGRRADEVYDEYVKPRLTPDDDGKFVALNVDNGDYEIDDDDLTAIRRFRKRYPDAPGWLVRVGSHYVDRLGGATLPRSG